MNYDIFVSYSRKDGEVVQSVVDRLKAEGYRCWMDVDGIESGDAFKRKIVAAIKNSKSLLFFSSKDSNQSQWTLKEINVAVELRKLIIPVRLDGTVYSDDILLDVSGLDFVSYYGENRERELERMLTALKSKVASCNASSDSRQIVLPGGAVMRFRLCAAGSFTMGSPLDEVGRDEGELQHNVTLTKAFWMSETPVTQMQWKSLMKDCPSRFKGDDLPVENVSWNRSQEFIKKVNSRMKLGMRLPTEAEWEYACRAGATEAFGGIGSLDDMGWYGDNSGGMAHPVGCKAANSWGLYDMHGNVWEWCYDKSSEYPHGDVMNPQGADKGDLRVLRGGSWHSCSASCRSAARNAMPPGFASNRFGFRVCLDVGGGSKITRHNTLGTR